MKWFIDQLAKTKYLVVIKTKLASHGIDFNKMIRYLVQWYTSTFKRCSDIGQYYTTNPPETVTTRIITCFIGGIPVYKYLYLPVVVCLPHFVGAYHCLSQVASPRPGGISPPRGAMVIRGTAVVSIKVTFASWCFNTTAKKTFGGRTMIFCAPLWKKMMENDGKIHFINMFQNIVRNLALKPSCYSGFLRFPHFFRRQILVQTWVSGSQTWIGWRFQGRLVMWIAGLVCLLIARISPWHALRFGSLSHYLRQFLCIQVVVRRKKLSCIRTSHTSAVGLRQFLPLMPFTPDHCQAGLAGEWKSQSKVKSPGQ